MSSEKCLKLQKQFISKGRLQNYTNYREYANNIKLSKDFYIPLSIVEISFRNSLNHFFMNKIGPNWLSRNDILKLDAQRNINNATKMIVQQHKLITNDNLIAELNFGFWIRLFRNKVFHHDKIISKEEHKNMMDEIYKILGYFDNELINITKDLNK